MPRLQPTVDTRSWMILLAVLTLAVDGCSNQGSGGKKVPIGTVRQIFAPEGDVRGLRIVNPAGYVDVESTTGPGIEVEARIRIAASRQHNYNATTTLLFEEHVSIREEDGQVIVEDAHRKAPDHNDWQLGLTVRVPQRVQLEVRVGAGNINVDLPAARGLDVDLGAGNIEARIASLDGGVRGRVSAGNLSLEITETAPTDTVLLSCGAGNISLSLPSEFAGEFDVSAAVGEVSIAGRYGLTVQRKITRASASGSVGTGGPRYEVKTATGTVRLK